MKSTINPSPALLVFAAFLPAAILAEEWGWFGCPTSVPDDTINEDAPLTPLIEMVPLKIYLMDGPPEESGQFNTITLDFDEGSNWLVNYYNRTTKEAEISSPIVLREDGPSLKAIILSGLPRFLLGADRDGEVTLTPIHYIEDTAIVFEACRNNAFLSHKHYRYRYLAFADSVDINELDWRCMAGAFNDMYGIDSKPGYG